MDYGLSVVAPAFYSSSLCSLAVCGGATCLFGVVVPVISCYHVADTTLNIALF